MTLRAKADIALGCTMFIWGATFVVVQGALAYASVFSFLSVRFILASAVMGIVYWRTVRDLDLPTVASGSVMGAFLFAGYVFQTVGLKFTTPSKAAFLNGSSAVIVPILLAVFGGKRISRWAWAGAIVATAGLYFVAVPRSGFGHLNVGDLLSFGSAVAFALHIIAVGRFSTRHAFVGLSFVQIVVTAILATIAVPLLSIVHWEEPRFEASANLIFAIVVTAIGCSVLGFTVQIWAQQHTSASHAAILFTLEPVFAAMTSLIVLHERLSLRTLIGSALILCAILLAELKGPIRAAAESPGPVTESDPVDSSDV
jgi:drug/metabolite transporter (DMT)-like permease